MWSKFLWIRGILPDVFWTIVVMIVSMVALLVLMVVVWIATGFVWYAVLVTSVVYLVTLYMTRRAVESGYAYAVATDNLNKLMR